MLDLVITSVSQKFIDRINTDCPELLQDSRILVETYEEQGEMITDITLSDTYGFEFRELRDTSVLIIRFDSVDDDPIEHSNLFKIWLLNRDDFERISII